MTNKLKTIDDALLEFQASPPELHKTAANTYHGNKYVPLEEVIGAVLPRLNALGITLNQSPHSFQGAPALSTTLTHVESGTTLDAVMPLMLANDNPQGQGSAITYARRYALLSILGLVADNDDDGNAATKMPDAANKKQVKPATVEKSTKDDGDDDEFF